MKNDNNRRQFLQYLLGSASAIGMRSLLTGLPIEFLLNGSTAGAAPFAMKPLIMSTNAASCPMNAYVPGTYIPEVVRAKASLAGAGAAEFEKPSTYTVNGQTLKTAKVWANLPADLRERLVFAHHSSLLGGHNDYPEIFKCHGAVRQMEGRQSEYFATALAQEIAAGLNTAMEKPLRMAGNQSLSVNGEAQPQFRTNAVDSIFNNKSSYSQIGLRNARDKYLDQIYASVKTNGSTAQMKFLEQHAISRKQAIEITQRMQDILSNDTSSKEHLDIYYAVLMLHLRITPVAMIDIRFGGDNHGDKNLLKEMQQHREGTAKYKYLWDLVKSLGMKDSMNFMHINAFGRTLQAKFEDGTVRGRDHDRHNCVMVAFGPDLKGGQIGGLNVTRDERRNRSYVKAGGINSVSGTTTNPDIEVKETLASLMKTMMRASGVPEDRISKRITDGKLIKKMIV